MKLINSKISVQFLQTQIKTTDKMSFPPDIPRQRFLFLWYLLTVLYFFTSAPTCHLAESKIIPKKLTHDFYTLELKMPEVLPMKNDEYFCTATNVTDEELYITKFDPNADSTRIHHIIIFGCKELYTKSNLYPNAWSCAHSLLCPGMKIIYAWGRNAPSLTLPKDVGFHVGQRSEINYLVLQAHYATPLQDKDSSGVNLLYTLNPLPNVAGIFLLAASRGIIPPNKQKSHLDINCLLDREAINVFAYRVHAHALGSVITGYRYGPVQKQFTLLAKGNPQWPQAFYPMQRIVQIARDDILFARCTFNSTDKQTITEIGSTSEDEMCNLYLMYFSPNPLTSRVAALEQLSSRLIMRKGYTDVCEDMQFRGKELDTLQLPEGNDTPLPRNVTLEESAKGQNSIHHSANQHPHHRHYDSHQTPVGGTNRPIKMMQNLEWPFGSKVFGQVTAIDVDEHDNVVIFHRGKHVWNQMSFDMANNYRLIDQGPISEATIVTLDPRRQTVLDEWGAGLFYLPHGLTIDRVNKSLWLTDVALHQVFKYSIDPTSPNYRKAIITLGERFVQGNDMKHFCKPTSVAVDYPSGDFYVADGYCNARVMRFDKDGNFKSHWGHAQAYNDFGPVTNPEPNMFNIPHKIVLIDSPSGDAKDKLACVADRENGRIQCFSIPYGYFKFQIRLDEFNGRLFSIAYDKVNRVLYAVAGPSLYDQTRDVLAFAFNIDSQQLKAIFGPNKGSFSQPHDIAVSNSGDSVYVVEIGPNNIWMFSRSDSMMAAKSSSIYDYSTSAEESSSAKPEMLPASAKSTIPSSSIAQSTIIDSKLSADTNPADPNQFDIKFNFELLRIRSRQIRNSITFNSILYFTLFALFLFIILLHYRYSSPHYSIVSFCSNICRSIFKRNRATPERVHHSSLSQRMDLGYIFDEFRRPGHKGFNRLPQNECEVVDKNDIDDDDDSDVLEDFNPKARLTKSRLV